MRYEYATTTMMLAYNYGLLPDNDEDMSPNVPEAYDGPDWELVSSAANQHTVFWFWRRRTE